MDQYNMASVYHVSRSGLRLSKAIVSKILGHRPQTQGPSFCYLHKFSVGPAQPSTPKQMGSLRGRFRLWRICYDLVYCSLEGVGISSYTWSSLPTITVSKPVLEWHHTRHCTANSVELHCVGVKWAISGLQVPISSGRQRKTFRSFGID